MTTLLQTTPKSTIWNLFNMKPHHRKYLLGLMILLTFLLGVNLNRRTMQANLEGILFRFGFFYGPGTWFHPERNMRDQVRNKQFPLIGKSEGY